jgi:ABC-type Fe3+-hydroxamate transport system substrate-binding protein
MKKQLVIIGIVALLVAVGLSGCNQVSNTLNPEKNKFVGTWTFTDMFGNPVTLNFFSDGTFAFPLANGNYDIKNGKLVLTYSEGTVIVWDYIFSNYDKTVTIYSPGPTETSQVWTKQ